MLGCVDPIPLDADHFGIAAPASRQSQAYIHVKSFLSAPVSPRGRATRVDAEALEGLAADTAANTSALQRIEQALNANAVSSVSPAGVSQELVDAELVRRLTHLLKSRFLAGAHLGERVSRLATDLLSGELSLASPSAKARGLAWCARLLLGRDDRSEAERLLRAAQDLADIEEVSIAEAFRQSYAGELSGALRTLSILDSPTARSASFIVVKNGRGSEALKWLRDTGVTLADIDSDGKFFVVTTQWMQILSRSRWSAAPRSDRTTSIRHLLCGW